jgi:hypothetical protein
MQVYRLIELVRRGDDSNPCPLVTLSLPKEEVHLCSGVFFFGVTSDVPELEVLPRH